MYFYCSVRDVSSVLIWAYTVWKLAGGELLFNLGNYVHKIEKTKYFSTIFKLDAMILYTLPILLCRNLIGMVKNKLYRLHILLLISFIYPENDIHINNTMLISGLKCINWGQGLVKITVQVFNTAYANIYCYFALLIIPYYIHLAQCVAVNSHGLHD